MIEELTQQSEPFDARQTRIKTSLQRMYSEFKTNLSESKKEGKAPHTATVPSCDLWYWETNAGETGYRLDCRYKVVKNYSGLLGLDENGVLNTYPAPVLNSELAMFGVFLEELELMLQGQPNRYLLIAQAIFVQAFSNAAHIREIAATTSQLQVLESPGFATLNNLGSLTQAEDVYQELLASGSLLTPAVLLASLNAYRGFCPITEWDGAIESTFPAYTNIYDLAEDIRIDEGSSLVQK